MNRQLPYSSTSPPQHSKRPKRSILSALLHKRPSWVLPSLSSLASSSTKPSPASSSSSSSSAFQDFLPTAYEEASLEETDKVWDAVDVQSDWRTREGEHQWEEWEDALNIGYGGGITMEHTTPGLHLPSVYAMERDREEGTSIASMDAEDYEDTFEASYAEALGSAGLSDCLDQKSKERTATSQRRAVDRIASILRHFSIGKQAKRKSWETVWVGSHNGNVGFGGDGR
ncbi:hypothetical protein SpCBS45565_g07706 [Spizellomyces sp. 'palustris']|nr:hypothetical protein SpCBS45565_g07706 [Spizellomyces sp. 'palustris']